MVIVGQLVVRVKTCVPTQPLALAASTVKLAVVATEGVPESTPVLLKDIPAGSDPTLTLHV